MRDVDLADSPLASFEPDIPGACDSLGDLLCEALAPFIPAHVRAAAFSALEAALAEHDAAPRPADPADRERIIGEVLTLLSSEGTDAMHARAAALNKQLGNDGRSDAAIGRHFGLTRAAINSYRREFEEATGIRSRASKSDTLRETCRQNRTGKRKVPASGVSHGNPFVSAYHHLFGQS